MQTLIWRLCPYQNKIFHLLAPTLYKVGIAVVECHDVPLLNVAAEIIPDRLCSRRRGTNDPLKKAQIITNRDTSSTMFDATVNVRGRRTTESAHYLYKDVNDTEWPIFLTLEVDSSVTTVAQAKINGDELFGPYFEFTGDVTLIGWRQNLEFEGSIKALNQL